MLASGAAGIDSHMRAALLGRFALDRVDIDHDGGLAAHRFVQRKAHQSETAGADDDHRLLLQHRPDFFQRAVGRDARTGERRSALGRDIADIEQITRVRHQQVIGIAAGTEHPDAEWGAAHLFFAGPADGAFAAAEPGMHQPAVADLHALGVRADRDHFADIFVAHGQRELHAAIGQLQPLATAQVVITLPDMQIAMTNAGRQDLQQDLAAGRLRRRAFHELQRRAAFADVKAFHRNILPNPSMFLVSAC